MSMSRSTARAALATVTVRGPSATPRRRRSKRRMRSGAQFWPLTSRASWKTRSCICGSTRPLSASCSSAPMAMRRPCSAHDDFLGQANGDWLMREIRHYLKRVLKRVDVTAKSFDRADRAGLAALPALWPSSLLPPTARCMLIGTLRGRQPASRPRSRWRRRISASIRWATG